MTSDEAIAAAARRAMHAIAQGMAQGSTQVTMLLLEAITGEAAHAANHLNAQVTGKEHANDVTNAHLHESLRMMAIAALIAYATSQEAGEAEPDELG